MESSMLVRFVYNVVNLDRIGIDLFFIPHNDCISYCKQFSGSKRDVWISINPETGSKMETLPPPAANSFCPISHPETVFIGKTEYKLSVLDTKNKDKQWNATFIDYSSHLLPAESGYPFQHFTNEGKIATFDRDSGKLLWMRDYQGVIVNLYLMKNDGLHLLPSQAVGINLFEEMTAVGLTFYIDLNERGINTLLFDQK